MMLYRSIHIITDMHILHKDLINVLHYWGSVWLMAYNPSKREFLLLLNTHYNIVNTTLKQVTSPTYLRAIIDNKYNWSEHTRTVV